MDTPAGYQEIEHTGDWALRVWAPTLPELLIQAARGMVAMCGIQIEKTTLRQRTFIINFEDDENLLVHFLSELLYYLDRDNLVFKQFQFSLQNNCLKVTGKGYPVHSQEKMIKAVTYHQLNVQRTDQGVTAQIVFDV